MPRPVLLAVDEEEEALRGTSRELHKRYGDDYRVMCERSAESALERLRDFQAAGDGGGPRARRSVDARNERDGLPYAGR
ncbi:MAG: hypothetical protein ACR2HO_08070 [Rubrobacteraceae bacterium]